MSNGPGIDVWDAVSGKRQYSYSLSDVFGAQLLASLSDGGLLAQLDWNRLAVFNKARRRIRQIEVPDYANIAPNLRSFAVGGLGHVSIWDLLSGQPRGALMLLSDDHWLAISA